MRILFLSNLYPPNVVGGYERLCFEVASGFADIGHQVMVLTSDYGGKVMDYPGQIVERSLKLFATEGDLYEPFNCTAEQRSVINAQNSHTFKRVVQQFNPQVLFVWNLFFYDPSMIEFIKQTGLPTVYLLTDNWLIAFLNPSFIKNYFTKLVQSNVSAYKLLYFKAKSLLNQSAGKSGFLMPGHAIFASHFMRDLYTQANFQFENDIVIYHGINLPESREKQFTVRNRLINAEELRLLVAGRIVELKGVHTAINALPLILKMLPSLKVKLTIVGEDQDGAYVKRIHDLINKLQLSDSVEFSRPVAEDALFDLFQCHDIYLFPSLYEPFSLTLIHALNAGIPTIVSDAGGNPEIVYHEQTGLLFPKDNAPKLAKAVLRLVKDHNLRQEISANARRISQNYTFNRMLKEIEQCLGKLQ